MDVLCQLCHLWRCEKITAVESVCMPLWGVFFLLRLLQMKWPELAQRLYLMFCFTMKVLQAYNALEVPTCLLPTFPEGSFSPYIEMGGAQCAQMRVPGSKSGHFMLIGPKK